MKGRDFFKKSYSEGFTPWSEAKRVDALTVEFISLIKRELPSGIVLDIGCGEGRIAHSFARAGFDAFGIDYVVEAAKKAAKGARKERLGSSCSFLIGDVLTWPFKSEKFDIAVDNGCFHHVIKGDWKRYLTGLLRIMKPRGFYMLTVFTHEDIHANQGKRNWIWHRGHYDHFFTVKELEMIFGRYFEFVRIEESKNGEHAFFHLLLRRF